MDYLAVSILLRALPAVRCCLPRGIIALLRYGTDTTTAERWQLCRRWRALCDAVAAWREQGRHSGSVAHHTHRHSSIPRGGANCCYTTDCSKYSLPVTTHRSRVARGDGAEERGYGKGVGAPIALLLLAVYWGPFILRLICDVRVDADLVHCCSHAVECWGMWERLR